MSNILDALTFTPAPLSIAKPAYQLVDDSLDLANRSLETVNKIKVSGSDREIQLGLPLLVRRFNSAKLGETWQDFCSLLRQYGIPLDCSVDDLKSIARSAIPVRLGQRAFDRPLLATQVQTADLFELSSRSAKTDDWAWPAEIGNIKNLAGFLTAVREAAGGNTPIGIKLPLGADSFDIQASIEAGVDFLSLVSLGQDVDELAIWGIARARDIANSLGASSLTIIVDVPVEGPEDALKCLALGASIVTIDRLLEPLLETPVEATKTPAGRLTSLGAVPTKQKPPSLRKVKGAMNSFRELLVRQMRLCGATDLTSFNRQCLRATTPQCAEVTGVQPLRI